MMIDIDENRLDVAKKLGATRVINNSDGRAAEKVMQATGGRGVDAVIEAVGVPATFLLCEDVVAAGGTIANIGVHGKPVELHLERLWRHNITITTRIVDTVTIPIPFKTVVSGKLAPAKLITHHFRLDDVMKAYDTFSNAANERALKVVLESRG
jgi:alcohol dehydrogenase